jgi:hypothetical protein
MRALAAILRRWCAHLHTVDMPDTFAPATAPDAHNSTGTYPAALAMEDAVQRHLDLSRLRWCLLRCAAVERGQARVFFTGYLQVRCSAPVLSCA